MESPSASVSLAIASITACDEKSATVTYSSLATGATFAIVTVTVLTAEAKPSLTWYWNVSTPMNPVFGV